MRPLTLVIRALGPYVSEQRIDFRELATRTLFLIHGPTGSGKTTILDAITFALYGECSGSDREVKRIRSDHADPSVLTEVAFDFHLGEEDYRVFRRPEQQRPKKRAEGTTVARARAVLSRRTGLTDDSDEGAILATGWNDVTASVEQLLGFRSDQFRQVVLLPQGQFRRLLLSDSRERQAILEVLFQTEVYRRIEEALKEASREVESSIKDERRRLQFVLEQTQADSAEQLSAELDLARVKLQAVASRVEAAKDREKTLQEQLSRARQAAEKIAELQRSREELSKLEANRAAIDEKRTQLTRATKAAALQAEEKALGQWRKEAEDATRKLEAARKALDRARAGVKSAEENFNREAERHHDREEARRRLSRLEDLTQRVKELDDASKRVAEAGKRLSVVTGELNAATQALEECVSRIEQNQVELREMEKLAGQEELLGRKATELERAHKHRIRLGELRDEESRLIAQRATLSERVEGTEHDLASASRELESLEVAWIEGQAAVLAQRLAEGVPCPVCGSTAHPAPARSQEPLPTERAIKSKRTRVNQLKEELDQARSEQATLEKTIAETQASAAMLAQTMGISAATEPSDIQAALKQAKKEHTRSVAAQKRLLDLKEEAALLDKTLSEARHKRDQAEKLRNEAASQEQSAKALVVARQTDIPEELQQMSVLVQIQEQASDTLRKLDEALEKAQKDLSASRELLASCDAGLRAAEDSAAQAARTVLSQSEEFNRNLVAAGFLHEPDFRAAKRTVPEIEKLERAIHNFDTSVSSATDRMQRAKEAAEGLVLPDLEALEAAVDTVKKDVESALREEAALSEQSKRIDALLAEYRKSEQHLEELETQYAVVGRISEVANGHNAQGITFQRFVLAALLDDVLIAATQRLQIMTHRRYSLQRRAERSDRRTAGGLDLEVLDSYTGIARPVSTLSGGESFLASLSLALGLSDVVQAYSGGIYLDTIFVDEGFGSLDPEALDLAFRALVDLQRGGRLVGIISHVPDLRERIDARLEVMPSRDGSRARFTFG